MKKLFLAAVLMLTSMASFAQKEVGTLTIRPLVGLNVSDITKLNSNPRVGIALGGEAHYQVGELVSVSGGLLFSTQGAKQKIANVDIVNPLLPINTNHNLTYVNIPILANVYVMENLAVKLGVQPAVNLSSNIKTSNLTVDTNAKTFDFSIPVGVSYEFNDLVFDARYNLGLTKVYPFGGNKNSVFQLTIGYNFSL